MGARSVLVPGLSPHVLIFPVPAQGHVNSMLKLAELFCLAGGIKITFLVSKNIHDSLLRHANIESRFSRYQGFHLLCLPDGIHQGPITTTDDVAKLNESLKSVAYPFLREVLLTPKSDWTKTDSPITTIIADGVMSYALDVAEEMCVPIFYFRTVSASAFWAYFSLPQLIENGEIPFSGDDMDVAIKNLQGMEGFLRRRDLPTFCRSDLGSPDFKMMLYETAQTPRANGLIINTFEDLEGPILSQIRTFCPNLYTIGPLHALLKSKERQAAADSNFPMNSSSNSLREEDRSCIQWLDQQPSRSVLYVSFGSVTVLTKDQLLEFWQGLVNSGVKFLWVIRPDSINEQNDEGNNKSIREELEAGTRERGYMVAWAPQEEVLAHPAIGGFWTHSGWNSTLESIVEGVPMICWPYFGDQQINSRFVGEVWKIGLDMKDTCDKSIVGETVKDVMIDRKDEFLKRAEETARLAWKSIEKDGSSFCNLESLIQNIRQMSRK